MTTPDLANLPVRDADWDAIMAQGAVALLHIGRWRANRRRSLADLGIEIQSDERDAWSNFLDATDLGAEKLLPIALINQMRSAENAARAALKKAGIGTPWGTFLPLARLEAWLADDERREGQYLAFRDQIRENYDTIRERAYRAYQDAAASVYCRLNNLPQQSYVPRSYREQYAAEHMATFMGESEMCATITYTREFIALRSPAMVAREIAERERILNEAQLTAEQRRVVQLLDRQLVQDAAAAKRQLVDDFLESVSREIRGRILAVCQDVQTAVAKAGRVPGGNIRQLRNLIDAVNALNVTGDATVAEQMARLQALIGSGTSEDINQDALVRTVRDVTAATRDALADVAGALRNPRQGLAEPIPLPGAFGDGIRRARVLGPAVAPDAAPLAVPPRRL